MSEEKQSIRITLDGEFGADGKITLDIPDNIDPKRITSVRVFITLKDDFVIDEELRDRWTKSGVIFHKTGNINEILQDNS